MNILSIFTTPPTIRSILRTGAILFVPLSALLLTGLVAIAPSFALGQCEPEMVPFPSPQTAAPADSPPLPVPDLQVRAPRSPETEQWLRLTLKDTRERETTSAVAEGSSPFPDTRPSGGNAFPSEPESERWSSFLPIWGEEAQKRGYELPFPFGISGSFFFAKRDINVDSVDVDIKNTTLHVDNYAFVKVRSKERNWSMRLDAWLFPFLNIYVLAGYTHEHTDVGIDVYKDDIVKGLPSSLKQVPSHRQTTHAVSGQDILPEHFDVDFDLDLYGSTYGGGATLVGGYKKLFFVADTNYTISDLTGDLGDYNSLDEQVDALLVSARIGWRETIGKMKLNLWIGETYWGISQTITGEVDVPLLGNIDFKVKESPEKPFSTHIGTYIEITKSFNFLCDVGSNFSDMFSVTPAFMYRF